MGKSLRIDLVDALSVLTFHLVVGGPHHLASLLIVSAVVGQNVFIHQEVNFARKVVERHVFLHTRALLLATPSKARKDVLLPPTNFAASGSSWSLKG